MLRLSIFLTFLLNIVILMLSADSVPEKEVKSLFIVGISGYIVSVTGGGVLLAALWVLFKRTFITRKHAKVRYYYLNGITFVGVLYTALNFISFSIKENINTVNATPKESNSHYQAKLEDGPFGIKLSNSIKDYKSYTKKQIENRNNTCIQKLSYSSQVSILYNVYEIYPPFPISAIRSDFSYYVITDQDKNQLKIFSLALCKDYYQENAIAQCDNDLKEMLSNFKIKYGINDKEAYKNKNFSLLDKQLNIRIDCITNEKNPNNSYLQLLYTHTPSLAYMEEYSYKEKIKRALRSPF